MQATSSFYEFIVEVITHYSDSTAEGLLYLPSVTKPHGRSDMTQTIDEDVLQEWLQG